MISGGSAKLPGGVKSPVGGERAGAEPLIEERDHQGELARLGARSSSPIAISRSVLWPTSIPALTATWGKLSN